LKSLSVKNIVSAEVKLIPKELYSQPNKNGIKRKGINWWEKIIKKIFFWNIFLPNPPARVDKRNIFALESLELNESIVFYRSITEVVPSSLSIFQNKTKKSKIKPFFIHWHNFIFSLASKRILAILCMRRILLIYPASLWIMRR